MNKSFYSMGYKAGFEKGESEPPEGLLKGQLAAWRYGYAVGVEDFCEKQQREEEVQRRHEEQLKDPVKFTLHCALADLQGVLQAHERMDWYSIDTDAIEATIADIERILK